MDINTCHLFFPSAGLEKLGFEHAFQPYNYSLRPFTPPRLLNKKAVCQLEEKKKLEKQSFHKVENLL